MRLVRLVQPPVIAAHHQGMQKLSEGGKEDRVRLSWRRKKKKTCLPAILLLLLGGGAHCGHRAAAALAQLEAVLGDWLIGVRPLAQQDAHACGEGSSVG